jgi:hypothetical protein
MDEDGFSAGCKKDLEGVIAKRVADFRLDAGLQEACGEDLESTCSTSEDEMKDEKKRATAVKCLQVRLGGGWLCGRSAVAEDEGAVAAMVCRRLTRPTHFSPPPFPPDLQGRAQVRRVPREGEALLISPSPASL